MRCLYDYLPFHRVVGIVDSDLSGYDSGESCDGPVQEHRPRAGVS
jgi:hypothetical protein